MELGSDLLFSEEIKQTMGILPRSLSEAKVSEYFAQIKKPTWAGLIVKGSLGERTPLTLEGIAKAKGLI